MLNLWKSSNGHCLQNIISVIILLSVQLKKKFEISWNINEYIQDRISGIENAATLLTSRPNRHRLEVSENEFIAVFIFILEVKWYADRAFEAVDGMKLKGDAAIEGHMDVKVDIVSYSLYPLQ